MQDPAPSGQSPDVTGGQHSQDSPTGNEASGREQGPTNGQPQGGGTPHSDDASADSNPPPPVPLPSDPANLDYAQRATDLVLERLKHKQEEPDPELLKKLGWTKEELQQFLVRWEQLKRAAREEDPQAKLELDDALRSLGLRASRLDVRRGRTDNDQLRGQSEAGIVNRPPAEFEEQFNAYRKGAVRSGKEGSERRP